MTLAFVGYPDCGKVRVDVSVDDSPQTDHPFVYWRPIRYVGDLMAEPNVIPMRMVSFMQRSCDGFCVVTVSANMDIRSFESTRSHCYFTMRKQRNVWK